MSNCCLQSNIETISGLGYSSPSFCGWNIVRIGMLIPDSYQLFVCPFACGRHGSIGAIALQNKDRVSYLYIDEADIVSGSYEDLIIESVDELFNELEIKPRALLIVVSCIDDLMGTDHEAFLSIFRTKYPDVDFGIGHMNPITLDNRISPIVNIQKTIYSFLKFSDTKDNFIMVSGISVKINDESEINEILNKYGYYLKHISDTKNYDEYLNLSKAKLNLVIMPMGKVAGKELEKKINLKMLYLKNSYNIEQIKENYNVLMKALEIYEQIDFSKYENDVKNKIIITRQVLNNREIAIDDSAILSCFEFAKFLYINGFNIKYLFIDEVRGFEKIDYKWILENTNIQIIYYTNHNAPLNREIKRDVIALGYEAGYYFSSSHTIGMILEEGLYGFNAITTLLDMLAQASENDIIFEKFIQDKGIAI